MSARPVNVAVALDDEPSVLGDGLPAAISEVKSGRRAQAPVTVTVQGCYQVNHAGQVYGPGELVEVPAEIAGRWRRHGYVI